MSWHKSNFISAGNTGRHIGTSSVETFLRKSTMNYVLVGARKPSSFLLLKTVQK